MFKLSFGLVVSLKLSFIAHALPLGPGQHIPQPPTQPNHVFHVPFPLYLPHAVRIPIPKAVTVERDAPENIHSASRVPITFHDPRLLDITYLSRPQSYVLSGACIHSDPIPSTLIEVR